MSEKVRSVTTDDFEGAVLKADGLVFVDFWAAWCPPCRRLAPSVEALAESYEGRLTVAKVDVDDSPALAARYGIQSIPTLILFRDGQVVDRRLGALPMDDLRQFVDGQLAPAPAPAAHAVA